MCCILLSVVRNIISILRINRHILRSSTGTFPREIPVDLNSSILFFARFLALAWFVMLSFHTARIIHYTITLKICVSIKNVIIDPILSQETINRFKNSTQKRFSYTTMTYHCIQIEYNVEVTTIL